MEIRIDKWVRGYINEDDDRKPLLGGKTSNDNNNLIHDIMQLNTDNAGAYLKKGYMLMDVDGVGEKLEKEYADMSNPNAFKKIVEHLGIDTILIKTTHGAWNAIFKEPKGIQYKCSHTTTYCGLMTEYKSTATKFTIKTKGKLREMIVIGNPFENDVSELPICFRPFNELKDWSNSHENSIAGGKNNSGYNIDTFCHKLASYAKLEKDEKEEVLKIINDFVLNKNLDTKDYNKYVQQIDKSVPFVEKWDIPQFTNYFLSNYQLVRNLDKPYYFDGCVYSELEPLVYGMIASDELNLNCPKTRKFKKDVLDNIVDNLQELYPKGERHGVDLSPWIATKSCLLNPLTGETMDFTPDIFLTGQLQYDIPTESEPNYLDEVLNRLLLNNKDDFNTLFEWFGTVLYRDDDIVNEKMLTLNGKAGNGKTTLFKLVQRVFKNMYKTYPFTQLFAQFGGYEVTESWLVGHDEMSQKALKDATNFKSYTSNSAMTFTEKYRMPQEVKYYNCKFMYANNGVTKMEPDCIDAIIRRMLPIRFDYTITAKDKANWDKDKWNSDEICERFLYLAVQGLKRWYNNHGVFTESERTKEEIAQYRLEVDNVSAFIADYNFDEKIVPQMKLYKDYRAWCFEGNYTDCSKGIFYKRFRKALNLDEPKNARIDGKVIKCYTIPDEYIE